MMMGMCSRCKRELTLQAFTFKRRATGLRHGYCRECSQQYLRDHYERNTEYYVLKARKRKCRVLAEAHAWLLAYFQEHPCADCGEVDPAVPQFDHADPSLKLLAVSVLVVRGFAWSTIEAEIAKCEVRCANCHMRRTAQQFGWYRVARPEGLEPTTNPVPKTGALSD
jgi:hypothetical protein